MRSSASPLVERMLTSGSSWNHMRSCSFCRQYPNSHSDGGRGSRLLAFFIFKRKVASCSVFLVFCGQWFHKWGNHGENSGVLGGGAGTRPPWPRAGYVAPLAHGFVFSSTLQVFQRQFCCFCICCPLEASTALWLVVRGPLFSMWAELSRPVLHEGAMGRSVVLFNRR